MTNDDGIDSVFLHELCFALKGAGHQLYVVAPAKEQSGMGAAKTTTRALRSEPVNPDLGGPTWTVDGTPADCVNIGLEHLIAEPIDGVVSGINVGCNASLAFIIASGTVGAAWEGALHGLPAIAFSLDAKKEVYTYLKEHAGEPDDALLASLRTAARHAARLAGELLPETPREGFTVHNINFPNPCRSDAPLRRTWPAHLCAPGQFSAASEECGHSFQWTDGRDVSPEGLPTDFAALAAGAISHTILDYSRLGAPV
ncbi:5'/3'-nucleotidase SurE [Cephaloticoccus primus]|uniref:5'/3'-nucleotidase SurE n=1 Tax=Cephaloticoccus primus TaxID=1548207 RepID=UPI001E623A99|nr:5'/3'-nucleotidase SurE [Cephaloticoccus primus]